MAQVSGAGRVIAFAAPAAFFALTSRTGWRSISMHTLVMCSRCLLPVALVVGAIGAMVSLQALSLMRNFGIERQLSPLVVATIVREIAPGFAAVVVAMQAGAGIAAELAAMRVKDELDALDVMGVDARGNVAGPRIVAAALTAPIMNGLAILCGCAGAYAMAVLGLAVPRAVFLDNALHGITLTDIWLSGGKSVLFGIVLGSICSTAGFYSERGAAGVGRAANRAVVWCVVMILVSNYLANTAILGFSGGAVGV